ncbi:MAG: response regulator [Rubrivivax sp.]|jgi:CheY-like chemotaxis protein/HPt (histidine-containing phosphotransfer) domain-containing protein|nr:response regulator [Rubrivivax sp.]
MMSYWGLDLRCRYANQAYLDWFGLTVEQAVGSTVAEILGPVAEESVRAGIDAAEAGRPQIVERRTTGPGGRPLVHEVHFIADRSGNRTRGVYVLVFETTRLKDAEQRLGEANQELERMRARLEEIEAAAPHLPHVAPGRERVADHPQRFEPPAAEEPGSDAAGLARQPSDEKEALLRLHHQGQRILLAEDNPVNQEVAVALLEGTGLEIDVADHGAHAVELAMTHRHDVVLMDIQMPVMDGLQATRELRRRLGPGVPIIAMTANIYDDERQACLDAGMDDHLAKPVTPDALFDALLRWLPRRDPAAADPASEWLARAQCIDGLDTGEGLANAAGAASLYQRMLRRYADIYTAGLPALRGVATAAEREKAMVACHSARGACSLIGATALSARLKGHEEELARSDIAAPVLASAGLGLEGELQALARSLIAVLR